MFRHSLNYAMYPLDELRFSPAVSADDDEEEEEEEEESENSDGDVMTALEEARWRQRYTGLRRASELIGASTVAIDNKIEQAMDLVKSHLMFAVREEVEVLKEQIKELLEKNSQLEYENSILRSSASPETLSQLSAAAPAVAPSSQGPTKASQPPPPTTS